MRLAVYQARSPAGDIPAGLATTASALGRARDAGVDMLVMPELFLPGYNSVPEAAPEGWARVEAEVAACCREAGVALTIGLAAYDGPGRANLAVAFSDTGDVLARYRKVQLFGPREAALFTPGDQLVSFEHKGTRFGLLICYDVEFPEHVRALARAGVQAVLVPTANPKPFTNVNTILVPARAAENALTIAYANLCGAEGDLDYVGMSLIAGPDGYTIASMGQNEGLAVADLPTAWRENDIPLATQLADYRPAKGPA